MRSKSPKPSWLNRVSTRVLGLTVLGLATLGTSSALAATATVTPFTPYTTVQYQGINTVFYPSSTSADTAFYLDVRNGFNPIDFTSGSAQLYFTITGFDTTNRYLYVFIEGTTTGAYTTVPLAYCAGANCSGDQADSTGNSQINIGIAPSALCAGANAGAKGCTTGGVVNQVTSGLLSSILRLHFVISSYNVSTSVPVADKDAATSLQVFPETSGPRVAGCPGGYGFFPGDGNILVDTSGFTVNPDTTQGGSSPAFINVFVAYQQGASLPADYTTLNLVSTPYGAGQVEVGPFENSTDGNLIPYAVDYAVQDSAGLFAFCGQPPTDSNPTPGNGLAYPLTNVFATDIQGFLRESNCFVATASYRDGRAPGVMLLRHFRDEVLSEYRLGRDFIGWYYANGPIAADWLLRHPIFRSVALLALLPLQGFAWITLHPGILFVPFIGLAILLGYALRRRTRGAPLFLVLFLLGVLAGPGTAKAAGSNQPYIDSLISELPKETEPSAANPSPYIDSLKRKMGKQSDDDATGYTDEIKKGLPSDGSKNYTDRAKRALPPDNRSAIEDFRKGRQLKANKGSLDTRSAFGFDIMASATRTYASGPNTDVAYESVYGNKWVPDFTLHYEWRPFTSEFIKKFGLYASVGASFTTANGVLNYQDSRFGSESRTKFRFIVLPVQAGLIYRFSVFDFMWPYFAGGPAMIGFTENRDDKGDGHHGYDLGYWFMGGVAFGLDWMSAKSSWDQYESTGVKHTYFTIDYSYLESVAGGIVEFTVDGVRAGFTFEL
ncbi:MAG: hypothetical protein JST04_16285 [Bdellovibrionales bacterium]|nr:hypothetical protein [Bdellovibrionales bacterium]